MKFRCVTREGDIVSEDILVFKGSIDISNKSFKKRKNFISTFEMKKLIKKLTEEIIRK